MSLSITSLNSGSNGNCYYIGNDNEAVLIDAGISCLETEKRMKRLGLRMEKIKAIFISHEHKDHISGLPVLSKKYQLPVYITGTTLRHGKLKIEKNLINCFDDNEPIQIGQLKIIAFQKIHDAGDPHSFTVSSSSVTVGVFTDLGIVCKKLTQHFKLCHAAFLEANYDEEMLNNGGYPFYLKKRITDGKGHLSNVQALELFRNHKPPFMSHLILSHLSKNNNDPELVRAIFTQQAGNTRVIIASRYEETALFHITDNKGSVIRKPIKKRKIVSQQQLSLF